MRTGKLVWLYFQQRLDFFQKVLSLSSELNVQTKTEGVVVKVVEIVTFYISFTSVVENSRSHLSVLKVYLSIIFVE